MGGLDFAGMRKEIILLAVLLVGGCTYVNQRLNPANAVQAAPTNPGDKPPVTFPQ
jgi:hypothetical protein